MKADMTPVPGSPDPATDPEEAARAARLRYVSDNQPGIRRRRAGQHFSYHDPAGRIIRDPETLRRIKALAIPPAWTDVWICPHPRGHLQATGRDAKGRKQYRYHADWRAVRDETKYERMIAFGQALPQIRDQVERDLSQPPLSRRRVLATVVRLLETTLIRVGNEEYARENKSFGLTTLRNRHVAVEGETLHFEFRGKSGKQHRVDIRDRRVASVVKRCQALPGQVLFQYVASDGTRHSIESDDVNDYLREITGQDFTAKDFRTWAGTVLAAQALHELETFDSEAQAKKNIVQAIESVAQRLGNTPSVCRKCYVHPTILDAYLEGTTAGVLRDRVERELSDGLEKLQPEEAAVLTLLRQRLTADGAARPGAA